MEYTTRLGVDEYELVLHFSDYKEMKYFENLIKKQTDNKIKSCKTEKECGSCKYKADKETHIHEKIATPDISNFTTLESIPNNDFGMMLGLILCMIFLSSGNNDSYYKGMCNAYEKIFTPNKQEENMQKAREVSAKLKKSIGELNKDVSK